VSSCATPDQGFAARDRGGHSIRISLQATIRFHGLSTTGLLILCKSGNWRLRSTAPSASHWTGWLATSCWRRIWNRGKLASKQFLESLQFCGNADLHASLPDHSNWIAPPSTRRDVSHNAWTKGEPIPVPVAGAAFGVIKGKIYVVSGATTSTIVNNNQIYDPVTNKWSTGKPIPQARYVADVDNILYVIGGWTTGFKRIL
jgi:hypothetical protein